MSQLTLQLEKLTCPSCMHKIIQTLNKLKGVESTKILFDSSKARIVFTKEEITEILEYINVILLRLTKEKVKYANCINIVENTKKRLKQNANYDMCIDNMIFNMWEEVN